MPQREFKRTRGAPRRRPIPRLLVVCGGVRTEPAYVDGLVKYLENPAVAVTLRAKGVSPAHLVRAAVAHRGRSPGEFDEVWCIADVDEFDITEAVRLAASHRVSMAISNPCFELWLLLHHEDCRSFLASYDAVRSRLTRHLRHYDKAALNFADYADGLLAAVARAKALDPDCTNFARNPSTSMWRLAEQIMGSR